jgi:hypothetical protein
VPVEAEVADHLDGNDRPDRRGGLAIAGSPRLFVQGARAPFVANCHGGKGSTVKKLTVRFGNRRQKLNSLISQWIYRASGAVHRWLRFLLLSPN